MKTNSFDMYSGEEATTLAIEHVNSSPPDTKNSDQTRLRESLIQSTLSTSIFLTAVFGRAIAQAVSS
jgi:hypothetical protein